MGNNFLYVNGEKVEFGNERNLLEVIRKTNIEIPTFCYHSELSIYGACRMCVVDIDGKGIVTSCTTKPQPGMKVKTHTSEVRKIRKIALELILANHDRNCTSCVKSDTCKLQKLSNDLGVNEIRFKERDIRFDLDRSSDALVRDPNKCILCGDCVRACGEIQGIGVIDFVKRGEKAAVMPAFGKELANVDCVDCGQCARVCPTASITPKFEVDKVWKEIENPEKVVVAQIAPAVRVAIGELFGFKPGTLLTGQIVNALKMIGFDRVFDTSFAADLTVIEEANEFIQRKQEDYKLPLFTSCCPGWVKFVEYYHPELITNLSSCKSPQQMFGSVAKEILPESLNMKKENLVVVSIMPCTAKKAEAKRPEFNHGGIKEVDYVLTTVELAAMIKEAGIKFENLTPEPLDMPMGFKSGAGVIFGNSGGVSEAVARYAYEKLTGQKLFDFEFKQLRGSDALRTAELELNGTKIRMAIVSGLKNASELIKKLKNKEAEYDIIEVMACPGGCIAGAGQPYTTESDNKCKRASALYESDKTLQLHKSQDNPYVSELYSSLLGEPNSRKAHRLLHTKYYNRRRITPENLMKLADNDSKKLTVEVCVGTNCYVKGSQKLISEVLNYIEKKGLSNAVAVKATFCMEKCNEGPNVKLAGETMNTTDSDEIIKLIKEKLNLTQEINY
jgi:NADH-quinone oxidoreductase subunit G